MPAVKVIRSRNLRIIPIKDLKAYLRFHYVNPFSKKNT